ncbi:uncharacterized protein LOC114678796 [Macaca mulatta]|uniref:vegetative cell wall protein gp1-like n=1 Tax=Macaca mulatta TaxID=9544 RepID=UPI0010A244D4|nr:vegetative cell wall protein gp1-like [Macaca mulatta]
MGETRCGRSAPAPLPRLAAVRPSPSPASVPSRLQGCARKHAERSERAQQSRDARPEPAATVPPSLPPSLGPGSPLGVGELRPPLSPPPPLSPSRPRGRSPAPGRGFSRLGWNAARAVGLADTPL